MDLLSLFMQNPDVFTDELIIDEMLDFFSAATLTTQYTTETIVSHCTQDATSLKRIRDEFNRISSNHPARKDDSKTTS